MDWCGLGAVVHARTTMLVSESFLAASQLDIAASYLSAAGGVTVLDQGCESL